MFYLFIKVIFVLLTCDWILSSTNEKQVKAFKAGSVEYQHLIRLPDESAADHMKRNVLQYQEFVQTARQAGCDIIVFPELGLIGRERMEDYAIEVPYTEETDCSSDNSIQVFRCMALTYNIYIVINFPTKEEEDSYFNTALAFDRRGEIVARYRKFHLYNEPEYNQTTVPDVSYFDTDFGARVGLLICADINYERPASDLVAAGVDVAAYPTAWIDELPFLTSVQFHSGWALSHHIPVIAAGLHDPVRGSLGSGIYDNLQGILNVTFTPESGSQLVSAFLEATTTPVNRLESNFEVNNLNRLFYFENLTIFSWEVLTDQNRLLEVSHLDQDSQSQVVCSLEYNLQTSSLIGGYILVAYAGRRTFGGHYVAGVQICGVVWCKESHPHNLEQCGKVPEISDLAKIQVKLMGTFKAGVNPMPVQLAMNLKPFESKSFRYCSLEENVFSLQSTTTLEGLYSMGLYGRDYSLDGQS